LLELFSQQDEAYRMQVLGTAPRIGIEAAGGSGWERWLGNDGVFIGMSDSGLGAS
jgi:transketolase